jgi:glyoxylase I family protein
MMIGIHHAAISVPNLDEALVFYCDVMGGTKLTEMMWPAGHVVADQVLEVKNVSGRAAFVQIGKAFLEIFEFGNCSPRKKEPNEPVINHGISHIAFVVEDLQSEYDRLEAIGVRFHSEPIDAGNGTVYVYGRDPFSNVFEIIEIRDDYTLPNNYIDLLKHKYGISPSAENPVQADI